MSIWWGRRPVNRSAPTAGDADIVEVLGFGTDHHPDGVVVTLDPAAELPAEPLMTGRADASNGRVLSLHVATSVSPRAPGLWYVERPETAERPPAIVLIAFSSGHLPEGTVIDNDTFTAMPVRNAEQVGAIRWWPGSGLLHQLYVAPAWRRQGIGTKLLAAAGAYRVARDWPPLWETGDRTDLGEVHSRSLPDAFKDRVVPRRRVMPPMTPPAETAGIDPRLLEPDA